ncbi:MAG: flagellar motor switch protein FliG [Cryobacterium sp.]|uniref:flagellar motor switch protein FliG n=1 Tax=unclassified Cryobacterium TaxID=2649013 RepID=UPI0018CA4EA4|nr:MULTISPECIES: flagellar motor switch protein FliG [unclassified Cryobacterium]MCY7404485.1 flagellar motor switch protein FliG [Cryobacterium sp.]MEC5153991.1 flagellar motor switch protein FliG [Cryobacterium sp. CAN_C3]
MTDSAAKASAALTGTQKVAVVLMNMDRQRATEVMKQFTDVEAEVIASEIVQLRKVDSSVAESTLIEFQEITQRGSRHARGGHDFAAGLLEASFGAERAAGVLARVATSMAGKAFEFLDTSEPNDVLNLLDGEMPQTIALVLAHLRREQASGVLTGLDPALRTEVARCIATMGSATPEAIRVVTESLKQRTGAVVSREVVEVVGGIQPLVDILNRADAATERSLLEGLEESDPALAEEVRSRMLTFVDIVKLESRDVQQVLRGIDTTALAMALKGTSSAVAEVIRANLSERNRDMLEDEIKALGPVRLSQVEDARANIVRAIRDMEAQGVITVTRGTEDEYVS